MSQRRNYPAIDVAKVICAILVVFTHTYCFDGGVVGAWFKSNLSTIGVPFFFIVSGYFYSCGLECAQDKKEYFKQYFVRIATMYIIWSIITLPVSWLNYATAHPEWPVALKILSLVRGFFLSGSCGVYWYLLSLAINSVILFWTDAHKKERLVYFIGALGFAIGVLYSAGILDGTILYSVIHVLFGSERNFLNVGLFYMLIGYAMRNTSFLEKQKLGPVLIMAGSLIVASILAKYTRLRFMHAVTAFGLFLFCMRVTPPIGSKTSMMLRKLSTAIYLIHFPFILLFDRYLKKGTYIDFPLTILFSVCCFLIIEYILPKKWSLALLGK